MKHLIFLAATAVMFSMVGPVLAASDAKIVIDELSISKDARSKAEVKNILDQYLLLKLQSLYNGRLKSNPKLAGTIKIKMKLDGDGTVSKVDIVSDNTGDKEFPKQISSMIKALSFDPVSSDVYVSYSINFGDISNPSGGTPIPDDNKGGTGK